MCNKLSSGSYQVALLSHSIKIYYKNRLRIYLSTLIVGSKEYKMVDFTANLKNSQLFWLVWIISHAWTIKKNDTVAFTC